MPPTQSYQGPVAPFATDVSVPDAVRFHEPPRYNIFGQEIPNRTKEKREVHLNSEYVNKAWEKAPQHRTRSELLKDRKHDLLPTEKRRQLVPESLEDCHPEKGSSYKIVHFDDLVIVPQSEAPSQTVAQGKSRSAMLRERTLTERRIEQEHYDKYLEEHPLFIDQPKAIVEGYVENPKFKTNSELLAHKRREFRKAANLTENPYDYNPDRTNSKNATIKCTYVENPDVQKRSVLLDERRTDFIAKNKMAASKGHEQKDERVRKMDDENILRGLLAPRGKSRKELLESKRIENIAANAAVALANEKEEPKFSDTNDNPTGEMWWKMKKGYHDDPNSTSSLRFLDTRDWWRKPNQYNHYEDPSADVFKSTYVREKPWVVPLADKITTSKAAPVVMYEEWKKEMEDKGVDTSTIEKKPKQKRFTDLIIAFRADNEKQSGDNGKHTGEIFDEKPMYSSFSSNNIFNPAAGKGSRGSSRARSSRGYTPKDEFPMPTDGYGSPSRQGDTSIKQSPRGHAMSISKPDMKRVRPATGPPTTMVDSLRASVDGAVPLSRQVAERQSGVRSGGFQCLDN